MIEEFLSREAAIALLKKEAAEMSEAFNELGGESGIYAEAYEDAANMLQELPAADVAPVVHGNWLEEKKQTLLPVEYDDTGEPILHDYVVYRCNRCGRTCGRKESYCHCGAKMD